MTSSSANNVNPCNPLTNHLNSLDLSGGYDNRGNILKLGAVTMSYDAEGNMISPVDAVTSPSVSTTWVYDAEGQRVAKVVPGGATTIYVHDAFGKLAAEYDSPGLTPVCTTCYLTHDMLGTVQMVTDQNQAVVGRHDYLPLEQEIPGGTSGRTASAGFGNSANLKHGLTGQETDGGTASDFFNARTLSENKSPEAALAQDATVNIID